MCVELLVAPIVFAFSCGDEIHPSVTVQISGDELPVEGPLDDVGGAGWEILSGGGLKQDCGECAGGCNVPGRYIIFLEHQVGAPVAVHIGMTNVTQTTRIGVTN